MSQRPFCFYYTSPRQFVKSEHAETATLASDGFHCEILASLGQPLVAAPVLLLLYFPAPICQARTQGPPLLRNPIGKYFVGVGLPDDPFYRTPCKIPCHCETSDRCHWLWQSVLPDLCTGVLRMSLLRCPKFLRCLTADAGNFDRGHSLTSLPLPPAALSSLPTPVCAPARNDRVNFPDVSLPGHSAPMAPVPLSGESVRHTPKNRRPFSQVTFSTSSGVRPLIWAIFSATRRT